MGRRAGVIERNHCSSDRELLFRFALWAMALGRVPLPEEIEEEFDCSYSTAYRWRLAWCDASGLPPPDKRQSGARINRERDSPAATGNRSNTLPRTLK